jgi:hypothetical protein
MAFKKGNAISNAPKRGAGRKVGSYNIPAGGKLDIALHKHFTQNPNDLVKLVETVVKLGKGGDRQSIEFLFNRESGLLKSKVDVEVIDPTETEVNERLNQLMNELLVVGQAGVHALPPVVEVEVVEAVIVEDFVFGTRKIQRERAEALELADPSEYGWKRSGSGNGLVRNKLVTDEQLEAYEKEHPNG